MSKLAKKLTSVGLTVATTAWLAGSAFVPVAVAQTVDINSLLAQIAQLTALVAQLQAAQGGTPSSSYSFTKDLTLGSRGADVSALQQVLISGGYLTVVSAPTGYFGSATKAALAAWQAAKSISPAAGYFGPKTRAAMAGAGGGAPVVGVPSGALSVSLAGPVAGTIPSGSLYNSVLKLAFNGGVSGGSVSSVTVTRGGFISNTRITGISAWDDAGMRYGNIISSLTSDGKATLSFGSNPFVVPAGQTKFLTIAVNLDTTATSASMNFSVNAASDVALVGGAAVSGAFPVMGPSLTVVDGSASLGDVRVTDVSVSGTNLTNAQLSAYDGNVEIGDVTRDVFKVRLSQNNSKEAVSLKTLTVYISGSIQEASDVRNWQLVSPEGNVIATADRPVDRYVTFNLASPYFIDKGLSKDFTVKADIRDGSGRYFTVFVQNDYDIVVKGVITGASIVISDSAGASFTAADTQSGVASAYFKMKSGGLTVSKSLTSPSGSSIAPSSQNVVLAEFDIKSSGEQLEIRKMGVQVKYAGVTLAGSVTVKDKATGENYLSIAADTAGISTTTAVTTTTLTTYQQSLSSYITIPSGQTKTLQVLGTVGSSATSTSNYIAYVGVFYAKRSSTNDFATVGNVAQAGNQLSVGDVSLSIVKSTSFPNSNRSAGSVGVKVAEFVFQASAADDVRVSSISFDVATSANFQNMTLKDELGNQLGSTVGTPGASGNSYSVNVTITKNGTKTLSVYADVLSSATTDSVVSVASAGVSGYGVSSGKALSSTPSAALAGQTISIATPTLTIAYDSSDSSLSSKVLLAGTNGNVLSRIKFKPTAESMTLSKLRLQMVSASTTQWNSTSSIANINTVYLYKASDNSLVGSASLALNSAQTSADVTFTGLSVVLPQEVDTTLVVKANVNGDNAITAKSVFAIQVKSSSTTSGDPDLLVTKASGGNLESGITLTSNAISNYFIAHAAAPSFAAATYTKGSGSDAEIARFTVTPVGSQPVTLASTTINVITGGGAASSSVGLYKLYDAANPSTAIATAVGTSTGASSNASYVFTSFSPAQEISGTRTYIVKANVTDVETGVSNQGTNTATVEVRLVGSTGYSASNATTELLWNDGPVRYSYTVFNPNSTTYSNLTASDSTDTRVGYNEY